MKRLFSRNVFPTIIGLLIGTLLLLSCVRSSSPTSPHAYQKILQAQKKIALAVWTEKIRLQKGSSYLSPEDIALKLTRTTGFQVIPLSSLRTRTLISAHVAAALNGANILLRIVPPIGDTGRFLKGSLHLIQTGELLGETALARNNSSAIVTPLARMLLKLRPIIHKLPPLKPIEFVQRLEMRGHCSDVAEYVSEYEWRFGKAVDQFAAHVHRCRSQLIQMMEIPKQHLLRVFLKKVPQEFQKTFLHSVWDNKIRKKVFKVSSYLAELVIHCKRNCREGRIELMIPFDEDRYFSKWKKLDPAVRPYQPIARSLVNLQKQLAKKVQLNSKNKKLKPFSIHINVFNPPNQNMGMAVRERSGKVSLHPEKALKRFLLQTIRASNL